MFEGIDGTGKGTMIRRASELVEGLIGKGGLVLTK